ncbi:hypothetical protein GC197_18400 [bacterium]|nr:hypothetical protein [bacterium]
MPDEQPQVFIRLGTHAEKDYLQKTIRLLDGFMVAANLLEATPGATSSLILKFGGKKIAKPYFLDPMTYAYGMNLSYLKSEQTVKTNGGKKTIFAPKRSYAQLALQFGGLFEEAIQRDSRLTPVDFQSSTAVEKTCQSVARYQLTRPSSELAMDEESAPFSDSLPNPYAVMAPYFFVDNDYFDDWLNLFISLSEATANLELDAPVHAVLCADVSFLDNQTAIDFVVDRLPGTGVDGVWLWFSTLDEHSASVKRLRKLRHLTEALSEHLYVYNMHGGYYSLSLCRLGMTGIAHGVGYGEHKDIAPVQGQSTPTVRYYLPAVHKRLGVPDIERAFLNLNITSPEDFFEKICDCTICKGVLKDGIQKFGSFGELDYASAKSKRRSQTAAAAKLCRFHFLINRIKERNAITTKSVLDIRADFKAKWDVWSKEQSVANNADHLPRWRKALSEPDDGEIEF